MWVCFLSVWFFPWSGLKKNSYFQSQASPFTVSTFPLGFLSVKESIHSKGRTQNISSHYILEILFLLLFLLRATVAFSLYLWNITFYGLPDNVSLASCWEINGEKNLLSSATVFSYQNSLFLIILNFWSMTCSAFPWLSPAHYRHFQTAEVLADTAGNSFGASKAEIPCTGNKGRIAGFGFSFV